MTKILSGRTDGPTQRTHGQPDQFWASIQPMSALFPLSKLQSRYLWEKAGGRGNFRHFICQKSYQGAILGPIRGPIGSLTYFGPLFSIQLFPPSIGLHSNYGGRGKLQTFCMLKIIPGRYIRSNQMTHMQYDQFWASIYPLGHSIGLFPAPDSIQEGGIF